MKYWVYLRGEVPGAFEPEELAATPGFTLSTLVCPAEGEILEKNWLRAGEFEDVARCVAARQARTAEPPPASAHSAPANPGGVDALLDATGARLFSHVAGLMRELQERRDERALAAGLQRQLTALRQDAAVLRENAARAEADLRRIPDLEDSLRRASSELDATRTSLASRDAALEEARRGRVNAEAALEDARERVGAAKTELDARARLIDQLSRDLADKEIALSRALALLRRLEQDLQRLDGVPRPVEHDAPPPPAEEDLPSASPEPQQQAPAPSPLPAIPPPAATSAQEALTKLLRKVFPGPHH